MRPLTAGELARRLDECPPDAPLGLYIGNGGVVLQAEPAGAGPRYEVIRQRLDLTASTMLTTEED